MRIAVIGAGLAGLTAARELAAAGHDIVVWEKSRGAGGRTATRRGPQGIRFDHGAPFLHAGGASLDGLAGRARYGLRMRDGTRREEVVGDGAASGPAKLLATGLEVRTGIRVGTLVLSGNRWNLADEHGTQLGRFDAVIVAVPAPQAADLLASCSPALAARAASVTYAPCWSVMAAWDAPLGLSFTAAADEAGLQWALSEAAKPGREPGERWVLQGDTELSTALLESEPEAVAQAFLGRFAELAGRALPEPSHLAAHRWRYARPVTPLVDHALRDGLLFVAGDWCGGDTAGAAIRSGRTVVAALRS